MSDSVTMPLDTFVHSISINRDTPHSLLLGAGASVSSGIPSADRCITEWKGRIFTSANPGLEKEVGHLRKKGSTHSFVTLLIIFPNGWAKNG